MLKIARWFIAVPTHEGPVLNKKPHRILEGVSLFYIFFPCVLFGAGWLRPIIALPFCLVVIVATWRAFRSSWHAQEEAPDRPREPDRFPLSLLNYLAIAALVIAVTAISGIGGLGAQLDPDFVKHNAFLHDLVEYPWPVAYAHTGPNGVPGAFVSYMSFYLPPAFVGKLFGWDAANYFECFWAGLGLYLTVAWFLRFVGKMSPLYALLFLFYGGLDIIGWAAFCKTSFIADTSSVLDYWLAYFTWAEPAPKPVMGGVFWVYGGNVAYFFNAFHHVLPGWILVLMILHAGILRRSSANVLFLWTAAPLGSVFVALGLIPYTLLALFQTKWKDLLTFQNLVAAPILLAVSGLFFLSNNAHYQHGWLWEFQNPLKSLHVLLIFYAVEFGAYVAACPRWLTQDAARPSRAWWWTAIACLLILPWYRLGPYCEVTAKASIPSLLVFQVYLATTIRSAKSLAERNGVRWLVFLLLIGSFSALQLLTRQAQAGIDSKPPPLERTAHVNQLQPLDRYAQFFADMDRSFFWKHLAKPVELQDNPVLVSPTMPHMTLIDGNEANPPRPPDGASRR